MDESEKALAYGTRNKSENKYSEDARRRSLVHRVLFCSVLDFTTVNE
jgi:hypothetical protein